MPSDLMTALIAGASAIGGGVIVAGSNYGINRSQARDAERYKLRRSLGAFLSVVNRIDHQLRMEPHAGRFVRFVNEQLGRFPQLDYTIGRARLRLFEPHLDVLVGRMHDVIADVVLVAPEELLPALGAISDLMATVDPSDPQWRTRWEQARADLVVASRRILHDRSG